MWFSICQQREVGRESPKPCYRKVNVDGSVASSLSIVADPPWPARGIQVRLGGFVARESYLFSAAVVSSSSPQVG